MKLKPLYSLIALALIVVLGITFFANKSSNPSAQHKLETVTPLPSKTPTAQKNNPPSRDKSEPVNENKHDAEQDDFITTSLKAELHTIAQVYEQQARYPHFSMPVTDIELAKPTKPFSASQVSSPVFDEEGNPTSVSVALAVDKLEYASNEPVTIQVLVKGLEDYSSVFVSAGIKPNTHASWLLEDIEFEPTATDNSAFQSTVDSEELNIAESSQEMLVVVSVEIDGASHISTVPFLISESSATLLSIRRSIQDRDYLEIELDFDVQQAGYYFVQAYLDDAKTQRPLIALQAEGRMSKGTSSLRLRAHQHAMKDSGSEGPYNLRIARSYRGAEPGENHDVPVAATQSTYAVPSFAFDGYEDLPYSDPLVQARLKALNQLGGNP